MAISIPLDVPLVLHELYTQHYQRITRNTNKIFLFSADQRLEHLHKDFHGLDVDEADADPEHIFKIAAQGHIGALATHWGLISHYAQKYPDIPYVVKLNGKTDVVSLEQQDPRSYQLWSVEQIVAVQKQTRVRIVGVGYTIYLGSKYEAFMLSQAAHIVYEAHQQGLLVFLWIYPRGQAVEDPKNVCLLAGAAGVGLSLGADVVKLHMPDITNQKLLSEALSLIVRAAGTAKILIAGGVKKDPSYVLEMIHYQLHHASIAGVAFGRNIHQRSLTQATKLTQAISALIYKNASYQEALHIFDK